jgi:hypothetical protein
MIVAVKLDSCTFTTRKLINTNGNIEGITVGKKLKQSKKNDDVSFLPT